MANTAAFLFEGCEHGKNIFKKNSKFSSRNYAHDCQKAFDLGGICLPVGPARICAPDTSYALALQRLPCPPFQLLDPPVVLNKSIAINQCVNINKSFNTRKQSFFLDYIEFDDCNPGIDFSFPGSGIKKSVGLIPGFRDSVSEIRPTD